MESSTKLVQQGDLRLELQRELAKQRALMVDYETILGAIKDVGLKKTIQDKLTKAQEVVTALEAGFVPVDIHWFWDTETKSRWGVRNVRAILKTMPPEVKEAWQRVEDLGIFKNFGVTGRRGGDPMLVGIAGGRRFLIGAWVTLLSGYSVGFTVRLKASA